MAFRGRDYSRTSVPIPKGVLSERSNNGILAERKPLKKFNAHPVNGSLGYWNSVAEESEGLMSHLRMSSKVKPQQLRDEDLLMPRQRPRPALSDPNKDPLPREKRVSFQDPVCLDKPRSKNKKPHPLILDALLPYPSQTSSGRQAPETKILIVRKGITTVASALKVETADHSFASVKDCTYGRNKFPERDFDSDDRVRFSVDMTGFEDDEIHFYARGKKLVVEGFRAECPPTIASRRVKETVTLPTGVEADNLRVTRDDRGVLYFEEAWIF